MVSIEHGAEHGGVAAVAIAYCLVLTWMGIGVGRARKEYNVPYPTMYLERVRASRAPLYPARGGGRIGERVAVCAGHVELLELGRPLRAPPAPYAEGSEGRSLSASIQILARAAARRAVGPAMPGWRFGKPSFVPVSRPARALLAAAPAAQDHKHANMFNCVQRAHQNSLENQTTVRYCAIAVRGSARRPQQRLRAPAQFNTLLVIAAIRSPTLAAVAGAAFVGGRVLYAIGYQTGDPKARYRGMVNVFGLLALLLLSAYSVAGLCGY